LIGCQPLEIPDGHGFIDLASATGILAAVRTDPSKNPGKWQIFHDNLQGFFILSPPHHLHIPLNIEARGAGQTAGGLIQLLNGKGTRYGLGISLIGGLSVAQTLIILTGQYYRTYVDAITTGRTFGSINITWGFADSNLEIPFIAFNLLYIGTGDQVDIKMPADLDQFGRENSHGTVIGGEGLVQFGHNPTNGR
jgi:hypothetical protein